MNYIIKEVQTKYSETSTYSIAVTSDYEDAKKIYHDVIDKVIPDFDFSSENFTTREETTKHRWTYFIGYIDNNDTSSEIIVDIVNDEPKLDELPLTWAEDPNTNIDGYYIDPSASYNSKVQQSTRNTNRDFNHDIYSTEDEAKSALAFAWLTQLMHNDHRYGGLITPDEWKDTGMVKYQIVRMWSNKLGIQDTYTDYNYLSFHSSEQRDLFLKENKELIKDYLMISSFDK